MAEQKPEELLIIRRTRGGEDNGHGGAWKIAFADFMTAMMALFLVLWLISATNEKTKAALARYFNPVKLVDRTIQKRGLNDPQERTTEDASDNAAPPSRREAAPKQQSKQQAKQQTKTLPQPGGAKPRGGDGTAYLPTHSEAALFRDPYAVLAEIAASGAAVKTPDADHPNVGAAASFQDPFQVAAPEVPQQAAPQAAPPGTSERSAAAAAPAGGQPNTMPPQQPKAKEPDKAAGQPSGAAMADLAPKQVAPKDVAPSGPTLAAKAQPTDQPAGEVQAARLQKEIANALGRAAAPNVEVKATSRGVLISLTDGYDYAMFAIGSAEPQRRTLQIMAKVAHILQKQKGTIIISGHTDGRRYRSRTYDNWRLSTARAQMALYMLVRGGLDEKRIERIEGAADHDLKVSNDPMAAQNRRIEILLRKTNS